jgi:hypothetical protein
MPANICPVCDEPIEYTVVHLAHGIRLDWTCGRCGSSGSWYPQDKGRILVTDHNGRYTKKGPGGATTGA